MARKKKKFSSAKAARRRSRKRKSTILARAKKEFTYKGHTLPELQEMPVTEFLVARPQRKSVIRFHSGRSPNHLLSSSLPRLDSSGCIATGDPEIGRWVDLHLPPSPMENV